MLLGFNCSCNIKRMIKMLFYVCKTFFISIFVLHFCNAANKDYGDFKLKVSSYSVKLDSRAKAVFDLDFKVHECDDVFSVHFYVHIKKPLGVIGMKIRSYVWNETMKKFSLSFNMIVQNICENRVSKLLLTMIAGLEDDCHVKAGKYNFTIADMNAFLHVIANGKFFYGRYLGLTDILAKGFGRLATSNVTAVVEPLN